MNITNSNRFSSQFFSSTCSPPHLAATTACPSADPRHAKSCVRENAPAAGGAAAAELVTGVREKGLRGRRTEEKEFGLLYIVYAS